MKVEWTKPAQSDLARIDDYYATRDPEFAERVGRLAVRATSFLSQWPNAGTPVGALRRKWLVKRTPYLLIYRVYGDRQRILRVRHEHENWSREP